MGVGVSHFGDLGWDWVIDGWMKGRRGECSSDLGAVEDEDWKFWAEGSSSLYA